MPAHGGDEELQFAQALFDHVEFFAELPFELVLLFGGVQKIEETMDGLWSAPTVIGGAHGFAHFHAFVKRDDGKVVRGGVHTRLEPRGQGVFNDGRKAHRIGVGREFVVGLPREHRVVREDPVEFLFLMGLQGHFAVARELDFERALHEEFGRGDVARHRREGEHVGASDPDRRALDFGFGFRRLGDAHGLRAGAHTFDATGSSGFAAQNLPGDTRAATDDAGTEKKRGDERVVHGECGTLGIVSAGGSACGRKTRGAKRARRPERNKKEVFEL